MFEPKPYNLNDRGEVQRLIREVRGYMQVSLHHGTDADGRQYAYDALCEIVDNGYGIYIDDEPFEPPTVGNEVV